MEIKVLGQVNQCIFMKMNTTSATAITTMAMIAPRFWLDDVECS